jgi:hypothetical protein
MDQFSMGYAHMVHQIRLERAAQERLYRQIPRGAPSLPQRLLQRLGALLSACAGRSTAAAQRVQTMELALWQELTGPLEGGPQNGNQTQ